MKALLGHLLRACRLPLRLPDSVPGPSPWYLGPHTPNVPGHTWREAGDENPCVGKTLLQGPSGPVLIVGFYHWTSVIEDSLLLIWHQPHTKQPPTHPVNVVVLDPTQLAVLGGDIPALCGSMDRDGTPLLRTGTPVASFGLDTTVAGRPLPFGFPAPVSRLRELLILCHSSGADRPAGDTTDLALLVAHPRESTYQLYEQDWFNHGGFDYGYEWVTRVARNPITGRIHGEGIRIAPFVLDHSLRRKA